MEYFFSCIQIIIAFILAFAMSIGTTILGCWMIKDFILKKILCTKETDAEIIGYKEKTSNEDNMNRSTYYCKYRYYAGGRCIEDVSNIGEGYRLFSIGSKVTVKYNPMNHKQNYIPNSSFSSTMLIGGILFIVLGVTFFVFTCMGVHQRI